MYAVHVKGEDYCALEAERIGYIRLLYQDLKTNDDDSDYDEELSNNEFQGNVSVSTFVFKSSEDRDLAISLVNDVLGTCQDYDDSKHRNVELITRESYDSWLKENILK